MGSGCQVCAKEKRVSIKPIWNTFSLSQNTEIIQLSPKFNYKNISSPHENNYPSNKKFEPLKNEPNNNYVEASFNEEPPLTISANKNSREESYDKKDLSITFMCNKSGMEVDRSSNLKMRRIKVTPVIRQDKDTKFIEENENVSDAFVGDSEACLKRTITPCFTNNPEGKNKFMKKVARKSTDRCGKWDDQFDSSQGRESDGFSFSPYSQGNNTKNGLSKFRQTSNSKEFSMKIIRRATFAAVLPDNEHTVKHIDDSCATLTATQNRQKIFEEVKEHCLEESKSHGEKSSSRVKFGKDSNLKSSVCKK